MPQEYSFPQVRVAAIQAESAWLNLQKGVEKAISLINQAASNGTQVLGFPEVWIPGYPLFLWDRGMADYQHLIHAYMANSLRIESPEMDSIRSACARNKIYVKLGFAERDGSSLYISSVWINDQGEIILRRRKLQPTGPERILFGNATGDSLRNVISSPYGNLGSLECWEHINPLLKYHTYSQHEHIHVASWPLMFPHKGFELYSMSAEVTNAITQTYAVEGGAFVLQASGMLSEEGAKLFGLEQNGKFRESSYVAVPGGGVANIYGPDGRSLVAEKLIPAHQEGILYAEIDLQLIDFAKSLADPVGHYSRPDLLRLVVNDKPARCVEYSQPSLTANECQSSPSQ